jgi:transcriptional antiterminator NusG
MNMIDSTMYERYHEGDQVKIIGGALEGTEGKIISIDRESGVCRVETVFFGRVTPADVDFSDIEKI